MGGRPLVKIFVRHCPEIKAFYDGHDPAASLAGFGDGLREHFVEEQSICSTVGAVT